MDPTQGNGSPQEPQGSDTPKGITLEDVNKAITARFKAFETKQDKSLDEKLSSFVARIDESLATRFGETKAAPAEGKQSAADESPIVKGMQKQMAAMQAKLDAAEAETKAERAKARDGTMRTKLREALGSNGIEGVRAKHAIGVLVDSEKRVAWDDSNELTFKDAAGEEVDFATGLGDWLKSDDAKIYLPPRGTSGSGDGNQRTQNGRGGAPPDPHEAAKELLVKHLIG